MPKTDIGPPNFQEMIPEVIKKNYGKWKYHEILKPGVLKHVSETGDELYTVRVGISQAGQRRFHSGPLRHRRSVLRRPPPVHQPLQHRVHDPGQGQGGAHYRGGEETRSSGGRDGQLRSPTSCIRRGGFTATARRRIVRPSSRR